jgi:hypothetical protein
MAASVHGGASQAPVKGKQTPAYRALEEWVLQTVADNPILLQRAAPPALPIAAARKETAETKPEPKEKSSPSRETIMPPSAKPAEPADEFDPVLFNRQMHPERPGEAGVRR